MSAIVRAVAENEEAAGIAAARQKLPGSSQASVYLRGTISSPPPNL